MTDAATLTPRPFTALIALLEATPPWEPPEPEPGATSQHAGPGGTSGGAGGTGGSGGSSQSQTTQDLDLFTDRQIAGALQIDVLGRTAGGEIKVYSESLHRTVLVPSVARLKYEDLLLHFGTPVRRTVSRTNEDSVPGFYPIRDVREALAHLGSVRMIGDESELGVGVWPCRGLGERVNGQASGQASGQVAGAGEGKCGGGPCACRNAPAASGADSSGATELAALILVNASEAARLDPDRTLTRITHPRHGEHLLAFDSSGRQPWYDFDRLQSMLRQADDVAWRNTVIDDLVSLLQRWRWREAHAAMIGTGLILATWVQSAWDWRPRIDVLGGSNTGKTMLCGCLAGLFRDLSLLTSDTTAAGLAQTIANQMLAVVVDEVDAKNRTKLAEQRKILEMLRSASRGTTRIRGSGNQRATKLTLRHLVWVAGITLSYDDQADRNRAVSLNLLPPLPEKAGQLTLPPADELADLGQRSLAVALHAAQDARRIAVRLKDHKLPGIDQRLVESYAVPSAMVATALGYDAEMAIGFLTEMLDGQGEQGSAIESDEENLIGEILQGICQYGSLRLTVGQVVEHIEDGKEKWQEWQDQLEGCGIRLTPSEIMFGYRGVKKLLRGTRWDGQPIDQVLRRLPGAILGQQRIGKVKTRGVAFALDEFRERYLGPKSGF